MLSVRSWIENVGNFVLYRSETSSVTLGSIVGALLLGAGAFLAASLVRRWLINPALRRTRMSSSLQYALSRIGGYICVALLLLVVLQNLGIDLSAFAFLAGALGIGIGFGLQNVFSNFVCGLIILIEQPVRIQDRVDLGDLAGIVVKISARSTTLRTGDNIDVIVPNSDLVTNRVINWSHGEAKVRVRIPIGVAYGNDPEKVRGVLLEVAAEEEHVLAEPVPQVFFDGFGDSSMNFELAVWNEDMSTRPRSLRSRINFAIAKKFKENHIEIPFPQRDINLRSGVLSIRREPSSSESES